MKESKKKKPLGKSGPIFVGRCGWLIFFVEKIAISFLSSIMTVLEENVHKVFWEANDVFEINQYSNRKNMVFEHNRHRYLDYVYIFSLKKLSDIIVHELAPGS